MKYEISAKEEKLNAVLTEALSGRALALAEYLLQDKETRAMQEYANVVAIKRLGFNDHGPVHMRQAAVNACRIAGILHKAGVKLSLEEENAGSYEDSLCAIVAASLLHDLGMTIGRKLHEETALTLAAPVITRALTTIYNEDSMQYVVRSLALEGILGHMAIIPIHSLEAGIILVADGCDMQHGRARIPLFLHKDEKSGHRGDMHKYSSDAVQRLRIHEGADKPIKIDIEMTGEVGFFQVEEVLLPKIDMSPIRKYIELYARIADREAKRYL